MRSNSRKHLHPSPRRQQGLSLVEMMIALGLGLLIVAALAELFVNISRTNQEMARTNSQIENARFALQFLQEDIVHGGFWGSFVPEFDDISLLDDPDDYPTLVPDPCDDYANWDDVTDPNDVEYRTALLGIPVSVHGGNPGTCGTSVFDNHISGAGVESDVLVVRHAHTCEPGVTGCDDAGTFGLYFQPALCRTEIDAGTQYALDPNSPLLDRTCTAGAFAPRRKFVQSIYYLRNWSNDEDDGIPTLVRSQFDWDGSTPPTPVSLAHQEAVALVEGIEQMRVELGIDNVSEPNTACLSGCALDPNDFYNAVEWEDEDNWETAENRGDGIPDEYLHCPTVTGGCDFHDLANVVAVKIYLLARANEPTQGYTDTKAYYMGGSGAIGPFNDGYKRHVFSTTVRLNNIAARRETP